MIEKNNQQTDFQLSRRQKWSRRAGPLHALAVHFRSDDLANAGPAGFSFRNFGGARLIPCNFSFNFIH
jgi:hypothetical protein